jgi:uncharacterized membrane protein
MQFEQPAGMYITTGVLFLIPCTLLFFAWKNLSGTYGALSPWRRYLSKAALSIAGVSTIVNMVWNVSWLYHGGSPHGMRAGPGIWGPLGPILVWTLLIAVVLSVFGKGKVRMLLLGWSASMYLVFQLIYMLQFD